MASLRREESRTELMAARAGFLADVARDRELFEASFFERCVRYNRVEGGVLGRDGSIDLLILSGGGDRGAFGAGFLKGWGEVSGDLARPVFDCVTGVSTGSMIAPYAFAGREESYETIDRLYREPSPDWAKRRLSRALIMRSDSLFDNTGLRGFVDHCFNERFVGQLAEGEAEGRKLLIGTTNADMGLMRVWDLTRMAAECSLDYKSQAECIASMSRILHASIAIPGVFPPTEIDGQLYVDGGVTMQAFLPGARRFVNDQDSPVSKLLSSGQALPPIRVWVIVNNTLSPDPEVMQPRWYSALTRSLNIAIKTSNVIALRDMQMFSELSTHKAGLEIQFRFVAIPDGVAPEGGGDMFETATMNKLADFGYELGTDPTCWQSHVPAPESADTYELGRLEHPEAAEEAARKAGLDDDSAARELN
ncbi:MAG: patatin-like phospholipase family protein [Planctomycetota bacterium]